MLTILSMLGTLMVANPAAADKGFWDWPENDLLPKTAPMQEDMQEPSPLAPPVAAREEPEEPPNLPEEDGGEDPTIATESAPPLELPTTIEQGPETYSPPLPRLEQAPAELSSFAARNTPLEEEGVVASTEADERKVKKYLPLVQQNPASRDYRYELGLAYRNLKRFPQAEGQFIEILKLNPSDQDAKIALAFTYLQAEEVERGYALFMEVYEKAPCNADVLYGLALCLIRMDCRSVAYEYLNDAIEQAPEYVDLLQTRANIDLYYRRYRYAYTDIKYLECLNPSKALMARAHAVRTRFRPSDELYFFGSVEEERDLITEIKTTKILNFSVANTLTIPVSSYLIFDMTASWNRERQRNLVAFVNNYNVEYDYLAGGLTWTPSDEWTIAVNSRYKIGRNVNGFNVFPFRRKKLWENTLLFRYQNEPHFLNVGGAQDSFVGRDFMTDTSFFVRINPLAFITYEFRARPYTGLGAKLWKGWYEGDIHNQKRSYSIWANYRIPNIAPNIILGGIGEYATFAKVDPDYYSYRKAIENRYWLKYIRVVADLTLEFHYNIGYAKVNDFTNVAEIIASGSPPPPVVLRENFYTFQEFFFSFRKLFNEHFEWEGNAKFYYNSNDYKTFAATTYLRFLF